MLVPINSLSRGLQASPCSSVLPAQRRRRAPLPCTAGRANPRLAGLGGTINSSRRGRGSQTVPFLPIQIYTGPCQTPKQTRLCSSVHSCVLFSSSRVLPLSRYDDWVTAAAAAAVAPRQVPRSSSGPLPPTSINPVCPPFICPSCRAKPITLFGCLYSDLV